MKQYVVFEWQTPTCRIQFHVKHQIDSSQSKTLTS